MSVVVVPKRRIFEALERFQTKPVNFVNNYSFVMISLLSFALSFLLLKVIFETFFQRPTVSS